MEYEGLSWTAVVHAGLYFVRAAAPPDMPIEVVGVELVDGWLRVVHAMPMRSAYHDMYEEAKKWRQ